MRRNLWKAAVGCGFIVTVAVIGTLLAAPKPTSAAAADCPTQNFIDVSTYKQTQKYPAPTLKVSCNGDTMVVESNGIPNFEFVQTTPNALREQKYAWKIPLTPEVSSKPERIPLLGAVAVAANGLPIMGPNEAGDLGFGDPFLDKVLDYCNGHTAPQGDYHFHARPNCLFKDKLEKDTAKAVGLVIGYAFDGYPIMAPYVCADAQCSQVKKVKSSWQRTKNVKIAWDAHQYVAGSGDLDECNGMSDSDGQYRYYATDTFPYFLACYHGTANMTNNTAPGGGRQGGQQGGQGGQPGGNPPPPPPSGRRP